MLRKVNDYGKIKITNLYGPREEHKTQRMLRRQNAYPFTQFTPQIKDFDILRFAYDEAFFNLPFYTKEIMLDEVSRADLIAYRAYRDTDYWCFILIFNHIADPIDGLAAGASINIPIIQPLQSWLIENLIQFPESNTYDR